MRDYVIITDSTTDLTQEMIDELDIHVIPMEFTINDNNYLNYADGRDISFSDFYNMLRDKKSSTTALINTQRFIDIFEPYIKDNKDIIYICFSSSLSGTYNSSCIAVQTLLEKYPDRKIYSVDSLSASMGEGLLVYHAAHKKMEGFSIYEVRDWVLDNRLNICHWFTVDDLFHLKRGGRVSSTAAVVGSMLSIKPVMHTDINGKLTVVDKARGRKASLNALLKMMQETCINPEEQTIFISHGDCLEDAEFLAKNVKEKLNVKDIKMNYIGPVIGTHAGPGTVALFFLGTER
ncbi:DegV family protein [Sedimentibacter sp. zth1]|uniref:DegV family protein n=1 Tax=Sedimentibacter sp. zth1 TaxID=2816908 RepID=UPI001A9210A3|nr:DegV family protein [Sedimentibacter sp. zth1]QSX04770.1 DegV family protein [Sedimentibacter sp. zth1]